MQAEVLIIGDSHTDTLARGCERLGIEYHHVRASGGAWFEGKYAFHPGRGLIAQPGPPKKKLNAVKEQMGVDNIFDAGLPVIASFGFNMGMLMSAVSAFDHGIAAADGSCGENAQTVLSRGFAQQYIEASNGKNFRIIKNIAKVADLTMVVPPRADARHNRLQFVELICDRMVQLGADVFDPSVMITKDMTTALDRKWLNEDGVHACPDYGELAVKTLLDHGVFGQKKAAA
ncbi:hypothetical protein [Amylibacter sp. IMCC11727]|uniref:hypothetical protein n=1 Tax=Amylibacter sp. IMCC11727 TaxID=3039851 RepID=UPI00244E1ACC|nr:hypothetical protein [Amylibacter sp. IMCC11727]WGI23062.1 hypothetical protein QBD29_06470 [Amylibacter sp. IMCC11727]